MARQRNKPHSSEHSEAHKANPPHIENKTRRDGNPDDRSMNEQKAEQRKEDAEHRKVPHHTK
jgi:hypothetical protein